MTAIVRLLGAATFAWTLAVVQPPAQAAGALAIGRCGAYGYSFDDASATAARNKAVAACKGVCRVVATVRRGCAAYAIDANNPCGAHGWASARSLGSSQNTATRYCYNYGGSNCVIRAWVCDSRG